MESDMDWETAVSPWRDPDRTFAFFKGRVALYAILQAAGIGPGDEVIVPGFTCVVVAAAVKYTGATPLFYDIDPDTLNGDPTLAEALISPRTKAIIVQHTFGLPADLGRLPEICHGKGICLIEDCAHAIGASIADRPVGTLGDAAFCSFQWSKPVTTGLGGLALVINPGLCEVLANRYASDYHEPSALKATSTRLLAALHDRLFKPSLFWAAQRTYRWAADHHCAYGSSSSSELLLPTIPSDYCERFGHKRICQLDTALQDLPSVLAHRTRIARIYIEVLSNHSSYQPMHSPGSIPSYLRVPFLVRYRDSFLHRARSHHIEIGDWFISPLHPLTSNSIAFGYSPGSCRIAEHICQHIVNLPTHRHVTYDYAHRVLDFVRRHSASILPQSAASPQ